MIYYSIYSILIHYDTLICGINLSKEFRNYFFQCCRSIWKKDAWLCIMIVTWCYEVNHTIFWYHSARKHVLEYVMFAYFTSDLQLCSDGRRVKEPFLDMFVDALTKVGAQPAWFLHISYILSFGHGDCVAFYCWALQEQYQVVRSTHHHGK